MTLEPATQAHAEALAELHASAFPPAERWGAVAMALQLGQPGAFGYVTAAGGMILARIAADEAEILTLAVAPEARRRGLARLLLAAAMRRAREGGAQRLFLEVSAANIAAKRLYETNAFEAVGRRPAYYPDGSAAIILRAILMG